jgi:very-short-patch-repair endonuclease
MLSNESIRIRDPQKRALCILLQDLFGPVQTEKGFPWLIVPNVESMDSSIYAIYKAICSVRGITGFATPGYKLLRFDFCIEGKRLIVEYDERQHFTMQRAAALKAYPDGLTVGFDISDWIGECDRIQATDRSPPHRDEQRAFYDSLRDIRASENEYKIIRLRSCSFDWTASDAEQQLRQILE